MLGRKNFKEKVAAKKAKCQELIKKLEQEINDLQARQKLLEQQCSALDAESGVSTEDKELTELHQQVSDKDQEIKELNEQIRKLNEESQNKSEQSADKGLESDLRELLPLLREIKDLVKENSDLQQQLDDTRDKLEQIIQTSQEDRYRKDKIHLINKYITQMDLIRRTLYDFNLGRDRKSDPEAVNFLEQQLQKVVEAMEATLAQEMVVRIQTADEGAIVNPDQHETIETVSTDNPDLDGKIYCGINPGYVWTLPYILAKVTDSGDELKTYRFLIRPEQIITYKLNK